MDDESLRPLVLEQTKWAKQAGTVPVEALLMSSIGTILYTKNLVVPTSTQSSHIARLRTLKIHVVEYSIDPRGDVTFSGLSRVLPGVTRRDAKTTR